VGELSVLATRWLGALAVAPSTDASGRFGGADLRLDAVALAARCDGVVRFVHDVTLLVSSPEGQLSRRRPSGPHRLRLDRCSCV
jgi:hypothetical protein